MTNFKLQDETPEPTAGEETPETPGEDEEKEEEEDTE